ncbi:hypothetical protein B0G81_6643 [Paraburkholderia sp. BL6665CI2N2]|nr:hypothetical protein B0G81_6643 [Paraburkholderia sp. BL6665CI2N2]
MREILLCGSEYLEGSRPTAAGISSQRAHIGVKGLLKYRVPNNGLSDTVDVCSQTPVHGGYHRPESLRGAKLIFSSSYSR